MIWDMHLTAQPKGETKYILERAKYDFALDPEFLAHVVFAESPTDVAIYHAIPLWGFYADGLSPLWVGRQLRTLYPNRTLLYGGVSPWQPGVLDEIDRLVEEDGVIGIKLYPEDIVQGRVKPYRADDPEVAFPIYERALKKGLRSVALHKAQPLGPVAIEPFKTGDISEAAIAFPDLNFEIVHGGYAFLEETALQVALFPNVCINLEGTTGYLARQPRKFMEIVGAMLAAGGRDRLIWATGAMLFHPRPLIEAFWSCRMPTDLVDNYGYPELTEDDKRAILGLNQIRLLGLDLAQLQAGIAGDPFSRRSQLADPWSGAYQPPLTPLQAARRSIS
jgi:predicted TIM-barrel fold metal-dependent hydrolase